jgi:hypothetical protein
MLRKGMVEAEDLHDMGMMSVLALWAKYEPIVMEMRRRYWGQDYLRDFEFLAGEMMKIKLLRDPSYKMPETHKYIPDK